MQRMVTIQAIILKTGFQGEMLVQTTFHAYPGRERHMKFPFGREVPMPAFNAQLRGLDGDTATEFAGSSSEDGSILSISASLWPGFEW